MDRFTISFGGATVVIAYDGAEVFRFLVLLFADVQTDVESDQEAILHVTRDKTTHHYSVSSDGKIKFEGSLGVHFAAVLFDAVIFNLLKDNCSGIAFHAGAVARKGKIILLPGQSGFGKSSMTACLLSHGLSYLTDELFLIPEDESESTHAFTRPICIKAGSTTAVTRLFPEQTFLGAVRDDLGIIIPHRLLDANFSSLTGRPALLLIPRFLAGAELTLEKLTPARVATMLMACDVNGRNLPEHGFRQVAQLAKRTPAYRITFGSFDNIGPLLEELYISLGWN